MWIHDTNGFYSVVALQDNPGHVLVRARVRGDLERFCEVLGLHEDAIVHMDEADYAWRVGLAGQVSKDMLHDYLAASISDLDYTSHCKEEMTDIGDGLDNARYKWYLGTWTGGLDLQRADKVNTSRESGTF